MISLPEGLTLKMLKEYHDEAAQEYLAAHRRMRILDGTDKNRMWEVIGAKFPDYQILSNTNHVSYVKTNILANIYTVGRMAEVEPTSEKDKDIVKQINVALEHAWTTGMIGYKQMLAGERAALLNMGVSFVGWDNTKQGGSADTDNFYKGEPIVENISPLRYYRDPFADAIENARYALHWDDVHATVIKRDKDYAEEFEEYLASRNNTIASNVNSGSQNSPINGVSDRVNENPTGKDYYRVFKNFVFTDDGKLHEIHTVNYDHVLHYKERKPSILPYSELFCNIPADDVVGIPETAKVFSNTVAINLINTLALTAEYKNQRPPKYVNKQSGLNLRSFIDHGADADRTFVVQGDASKAVHYHRFPEISAQGQAIINQLGLDIQQVTGVDGRYTGRDTGSILTTGGIESNQDLVSMIDQPKIINYERYSKRLTQLVLMNILKFGQDRKYFVKNQRTNKYESVSVKFTEIDAETLFNYNLNVSPILPKSKQRMAQMANTLMEKQLQYGASGMQVELITPEEWLMFQDLPNQEYMMDRMGIQRSQNYVDMISQAIFTYATLTQNGLDPSAAVVETANMIQNQRGVLTDRPVTTDLQSPLQNQG